MKFICVQLLIVSALVMVSSKPQTGPYYIDDACVWPTELNIMAVTGVATGDGCAEICLAVTACTHYSWTNDFTCVGAAAPNANYDVIFTPPPASLCGFFFNRTVQKVPTRGYYTLLHPNGLVPNGTFPGSANTGK